MPCLTLVGTPEFSSYARGKDATVDIVITTVASPADAGQRAPMSVSAVLDRSGSMGGTKLDLVKRTCHFMVQQMSQGDRLGLVAYDSKVDEVYRLSSMCQTAKETAQVQLSRMEAGSTTNLSGGLFKGLHQQKAFKVEEGDSEPVRCVLLFTDGLANVGIVDSNKLITGLSKSLEGNPRVQVHTLGFGQDHDAGLLEKLADVGLGNYYFIENPEDIPQAFADALGGLASVIAQNVEIEISKTDGDVMLERVFSGFQVLPGENGSKRIWFGDIYSEERKDIMVRLRIPKCDSAKEQEELVKVKVSYFDAIESTIKTSEITINVARVEAYAKDRNPNEDVVDQRCRFEAISALKKATKVADRGDLGEALKVVKSGRERLAKNVDLSPEARNAVLELEQMEAHLLSRKGYDSVGSKKLRAVTQQYMKQRSAPRYWSSQQHQTVSSYRTSVLTGGDVKELASANANAIGNARVKPKAQQDGNAKADAGSAHKDTRPRWPPLYVPPVNNGGPSTLAQPTFSENLAPGALQVPQIDTIQSQAADSETPRSPWRRFVSRMSRSMSRSISMDSANYMENMTDNNSSLFRRRSRRTNSSLGQRGSFGGEENVED